MISFGRIVFGMCFISNETHWKRNKRGWSMLD